MAELKNTPLREFHLEMGAKMVPRSGWNLPLHFSEGAADEHHCCRSKAALFDLCADGRYRIAFPGALQCVSKFLFDGEKLLTQGRCREDVLMDKEGIAIGPCQVSLMGEDDLFVTVPFQCTAKTEKLFQSEKVEFVSLSDYLACIGISGSESRKTLVTCGVKEEELPQKGETKLLELDGLRAIVSFSQHFDEEGFEINFNAECADQIWDLLLETDLPWPAGLAAQETLALEMGSRGANEFLIPRRAADILEKTALITFDGRRAPFGGVKLFDVEGRERGVVTTGAFCPGSGQAVAWAFFPEGVPEGGTLLHADAGGVTVSGTVGG